MKPSLEEVLDTLFAVCDKDKESPVNSQGDMVTVTVYELERFASAIAAKAAKDAYAAGAEEMRERARHNLTDRHTGAEAVFESEKSDYLEGRMDEADFCLQAIRALPITPNQVEGEQNEQRAYSV